MCGIVAYKGHKNCYPILLDGLHKLEYRGYDSAGVACLTENGKIVVTKRSGKVRQLEKGLKKNNLTKVAMVQELHILDGQLMENQIK